MDPQLADATRRTRLANERTFLSWLRGGLTSLAVGIGAGAVVTDVVSTEWPFVVLGVGFGIFGVMLIAYGVVRQRAVDRALDGGGYAPLEPRAAIALAAFGVALGVISVAAVLIEI